MPSDLKSAGILEEIREKKRKFLSFYRAYCVSERIEDFHEAQRIGHDIIESSNLLIMSCNSEFNSVVYLLTDADMIEGIRYTRNYILRCARIIRNEANRTLGYLAEVRSSIKHS